MNVLEFNTIYIGFQVSAITMVTFLITRCLWGRGVRVWPSLAGADWPLSDSSGHRMSGWQPRHKLRCFRVSVASSPTHSLWSGRTDNSDVSPAQIRTMTARHRCLRQRKVDSHHPSSGINRDVKRRGIYRLVAREERDRRVCLGHVTGLMRYESHSSESLSQSQPGSGCCQAPSPNP